MQTFLINLVILLLGWMCGVLINYLSDALPYHRRLVPPFCIQCGERQTWKNYALWPRRCESCQKRRSWSTWAVELVSAGLVLWMWISPPPGLGFWGGLVLLVYFGVVVVIDMKYRIILHPVSIAGAVIGALIGILLHGPLNTLIGGLVGYGIMYVFYYFGVLFARFMSKRRGETIEEGDALGFGDVNLTGVIGLILGWPSIIPGLMLAVILGGLFSLFYIVAKMVVRRYQSMAVLPYGPFLVLGAVFLLYFAGFMQRLAAP